MLADFYSEFSFPPLSLSPAFPIHPGHCRSVTHLIVSLFFPYYSRWGEAGDEGGKVDEQRNAECVSVAVFSQGPAGKSCSKEVIMMMMNGD